MPLLATDRAAIVATTSLLRDLRTLFGFSRHFSRWPDPDQGIVVQEAAERIVAFQAQAAVQNVAEQLLERSGDATSERAAVLPKAAEKHLIRAGSRQNEHGIVARAGLAFGAGPAVRPSAQLVSAWQSAATEWAIAHDAQQRNADPADFLQAAETAHAVMFRKAVSEALTAFGSEPGLSSRAVEDAGSHADVLLARFARAAQSGPTAERDVPKHLTVAPVKGADQAKPPARRVLVPEAAIVHAKNSELFASLAAAADAGSHDAGGARIKPSGPAALGLRRVARLEEQQAVRIASAPMSEFLYGPKNPLVQRIYARETRDFETDRDRALDAVSVSPPPDPSEELTQGRSRHLLQQARAYALGLQRALEPPGVRAPGVDAALGPQRTPLTVSRRISVRKGGTLRRTDVTEFRGKDFGARRD